MVNPSCTMSGTKGRSYVAIAALLAAGVYLDCIGNGFVYDDLVQVVNNYWITDTRYIGTIFSSSAWEYVRLPSSYYRPMMHMIYMAARHLFGPQPWGFHLTNVALHVAVTVTLYYVIAAVVQVEGRLDTRKGLAAFCGAALFAVHPVHTEAVCWIAGLPDLAFTLFYLLSFFAYIKSRRETVNSTAYRLGSLFLFSLAILSKEPALTLPAVLAAFDYAEEGGIRGWKGSLLRYAPYAALVGLYLPIRFIALGAFAPNRSHTDLSLLQSAFSAVPLLGGYLRLLVLPTGLSGFHEFIPITGVPGPGQTAGFVLVLAFMGAAWLAVRKDRSFAVAAMLVVAPLLPALYIPALGKSPFAERYLYLPSAGLSLAVALMVVRTQANNAAIRRMSTAAVLSVASVFAAGTVARNTVWKDDVSFWSDAATKAPAAAYPQNALGNALSSAGRTGEAAASFARAIELDPSFGEPYVGLGNYHNAKGDLDKAETLYGKALKIDPNDANALNNLGVVYARRGRLREAAALFSEATRADRYYTDAYANLARAYRKLGMPDKEQAAVEMLKSVSNKTSSTHKSRLVVGGKKGG